MASVFFFGYMISNVNLIQKDIMIDILAKYIAALYTKIDKIN